MIGKECKINKTIMIKNFTEFEKSIRINEQEVIPEAKAEDVTQPMVDLEKETVQFPNEHDAKEAVETLTKGGIKKEYITRTGKFNDTLKFINNHEFKAAIEILKLQ